mmetsp:Transcript_11597/g.21393  ORF Transcript_11597/g.21393 Transcript_11597/m.21393 type:complete len:101 (+) Transcript_11597:777-1079(+)
MLFVCFNVISLGRLADNYSACEFCSARSVTPAVHHPNLSEEKRKRNIKNALNVLLAPTDHNTNTCPKSRKRNIEKGSYNDYAFLIGTQTHPPSFRDSSRH